MKIKFNRKLNEAIEDFETTKIYNYKNPNTEKVGNIEVINLGKVLSKLENDLYDKSDIQIDFKVYDAKKERTKEGQGKTFRIVIKAIAKDHGVYVYDGDVYINYNEPKILFDEYGSKFTSYKQFVDYFMNGNLNGKVVGKDGKTKNGVNINSALKYLEDREKAKEEKTTTEKDSSEEEKKDNKKSTFSGFFKKKKQESISRFPMKEEVKNGYPVTFTVEQDNGEYRKKGYWRIKIKDSFGVDGAPEVICKTDELIEHDVEPGDVIEGKIADAYFDNTGYFVKPLVTIEYNSTKKNNRRRHMKEDIEDLDDIDADMDDKKERARQRWERRKNDARSDRDYRVRHNIGNRFKNLDSIDAEMDDEDEFAKNRFARRKDDARADRDYWAGKRFPVKESVDDIEKNEPDFDTSLYNINHHGEYKANVDGVNVIYKYSYDKDMGGEYFITVGENHAIFGDNVFPGRRYSNLTQTDISMLKEAVREWGLRKIYDYPFYMFDFLEDRSKTNRQIH